MPFKVRKIKVTIMLDMGTKEYYHVDHPMNARKILDVLEEISGVRFKFREGGE